MWRERFLIRIVFDTVVAACTLGICLDLVTAHVAVEYFTVHHPKVVESKSPIVMALIWGVGASWWFGAIGGLFLAFVNSRRQVPFTAKAIRPMVWRACASLWASMIALLGLVYGFIGLIPIRQRRPTFDFDRRLMSVALTHMTEYVLGTITVVIMAVIVWRRSATVNSL